MKKLKVGDYVRIKKDLEPNECGISEATLSEWKGKIAQIMKVVDNTTFRVDIDNRYYIWDISWFEDEDNIEIKPKSKYEVGDYVRIRSDLQQMYDDEVETNVGLESEMIDYAGKLARITDVSENEKLNYTSYLIDIDDGNWYWEDMFFEYRLGNYEDNDFSKSKTTYTVGYKYHGMTHEFVGFLDKWCVGRCEFHREDGTILVVNYEDISYVIPKDGVE